MDFDRQRGDPRLAATRFGGISFSTPGCVTCSRSSRLAMPEAMYETDAAVSQYCESHYGKTYFDVPNFPAQCAAVCCHYTQGRPRRKALDLGCAVGRASFELAKEFDLVTGIDFSARFIRVALQLKEKGIVHFELVEEGDVVSYHEARLSELGLDQVADRVEFFQGDATNLKPQFTGYDLILAANLIDRLYDPKTISGDDSRAAESGGYSGHHLALHLAGGIHEEGELAGRLPQRRRALHDAGRPPRSAESTFRHAGCTAETWNSSFAKRDGSSSTRSRN